MQVISFVYKYSIASKVHPLNGHTSLKVPALLIAVVEKPKVKLMCNWSIVFNSRRRAFSSVYLSAFPRVEGVGSHHDGEVCGPTISARG